MKLLGSDPDIETIYGRIRRQIYNLQPDFQRGEVWTQVKKKRLIDSILREWHIPPIHIIEKPNSEVLEVLDGQQRLAAIRDFIECDFSVDGSIEPYSVDISRLEGLFYNELPAKIRSKFDSYTIRVFTVSNYEPKEPAELFYRLNQPTNLTSAEKRNAFYGPIRNQVKDVKAYMDSLEFEKEFLGFSNSRMAYEDVISKIFFSIESGSLSDAISANKLAERFRSNEPLSAKNLSKVMSAMKLFSKVRRDGGSSVKFNKATFYSWLMFAIEFSSLNEMNENELIGIFIPYVYDFEVSRFLVKQGTYKNNKSPLLTFRGFKVETIVLLLEIFNDRSASRVSNPSSVKLRDIILWLLCSVHENFRMKTSNERLKIVNEVSRQIGKETERADLENTLLGFIDLYSWGTL